MEDGFGAGQAGQSHLEGHSPLARLLMVPRSLIVPSFHSKVVRGRGGGGGGICIFLRESPLLMIVLPSAVQVSFFGANLLIQPRTIVYARNNLTL